ncbi:MAG: mechanosensitive ion channel family protein [Cytophagaceae bacterium]
MNKIEQELDIFTNAYHMIIDKMISWFHNIVLILPNFVLAVVVFLAFNLVSKLASKILIKILAKTNISSDVVRIIVRIVAIAIMFVGIFFCLGILQLDKTVTSLLAGAGIIGLALSFAFQDIATNLISGFIIAIKKPFKVGDLVETNGFIGVISEIDIRAIHVKNHLGQDIIIPSKDVLQRAIINYTTFGERRVEFKVGVSYNDNLEIALEVARKAISDLTIIDKTKDIEIFYEGFGDSSITMVVRFWISLVQNHNFIQARNNAVIAIHKAFKENDITIPFPMRTLTLANPEKGLQVTEAKIREIGTAVK